MVLGRAHCSTSLSYKANSQPPIPLSQPAATAPGCTKRCVWVLFCCNHPPSRPPHMKPAPPVTSSRFSKRGAAATGSCPDIARALRRRRDMAHPYQQPLFFTTLRCFTAEPGNGHVGNGGNPEGRGQKAAGRGRRRSEREGAAARRWLWGGRGEVT